MHRWFLFVVLIVALLSAGCDDPPSQNTNDTSNNNQDTSDLDTEDSSTDDTAQPDTTTQDTTPQDTAIDIDLGPCPDPPTGPEPALGRWSLSLFHFNIQYVAGGLENFAELALGLPQLAEGTNLTEEEVEDRIITESFEPLIEILERNPELALTLELQGYMIDVMLERHPELIDRMRTLVQAQQLELASIHWSDQFFLAFGRADMDESWRRTQASFAAANLDISRAVFTQEGQFGEGFAEWLAQTRPDAIMVMARNLKNFYQASLPQQPRWRVGALDVLLPNTYISDDLVLTWNFFDDGELLATGDLNPYAGKVFARNERSIAVYEHELKCLAQNGTRVGRISDYLDALEAASVAPSDMPPFLDGTWQPGSTRGPLRWLGGIGGAWGKHEADNLVLTTCVKARAQVLALQTLADDLGATAPASVGDALSEAWRELLWGQVSDARGVNPWWAEIQYGLEHCGRAHTLAAAELEAERTRRSAGALSIDTATGTVAELGSPPAPVVYEAVDANQAPFAVNVLDDGGGRAYTLRWLREQGVADAPLVLEIEWPAIDGAEAAFTDCLQNTAEPHCRNVGEPMRIALPRMAGFIGYRPALTDTIARYTEADFDFQEQAMTDAAWSVAGDGFVDLGTGHFLVKNTEYTHLAIGWPAGNGRNDVIWITDETLTQHESDTWRFWVTSDEAEALALAERNLEPVVVVEP